MQITDTLHGRTVEDVRRNKDGSVTLFCDCGRTVTLHVVDGQVRAKPPELVLPDKRLEEIVSERMNLLQAFVGFTIDYVVSNANDGSITIVCQPQRHDRETYKKSLGYREVRLTHSNGLINELPPVSAVVKLPSMSLFGKPG